jgi:hypothetical protein
MKYLIIEIDDDVHGFGSNYTMFRKPDTYATLDGTYRVVRREDLTDQDEEVTEWIWKRDK